MFPAGILKNTLTGQFHPIVFRPAPMASGSDIDSGALRHRSIGHRTDGFDSIEEATAHIDNTEGWHNTGLLWSWNGLGTPALTLWFQQEVAA
jgi:hypothetical protein